eukprot:SAG11_NODE_16495_length_546_cov_0.420582_2_plen_117_part_00
MVAAQVSGLRFAGFEERRYPFMRGVFTVDPDEPVANNRPHYRSVAGGHLYYYVGTSKWYLNNQFTPDNVSSFANISATGAVPIGAAVWRCQTGSNPKWCDRELTMSELTDAEDGRP